VTPEEVRLLLYVKGRGLLLAAESLPDSAELSDGDRRKVVAELRERGLVDGAGGAAFLTPGGERALLEALREDLGREIGALEERYPRFLELDREMKALATRWQRREIAGASAANDHGDPAYDFPILEALIVEVHPEVEQLFIASDAIRRATAPYRARLASAIARLTDGDVDSFTGTKVDSYHTVWFELHEYLLTVLGKERGGE